VFGCAGSSLSTSCSGTALRTVTSLRPRIQDFASLATLSQEILPWVSLIAGNAEVPRCSTESSQHTDAGGDADDGVRRQPRHPKVLVVIGGLAFAREFGYGTVIPTYLGEPRRTRVVVANWLSLNAPLSVHGPIGKRMRCASHHGIRRDEVRDQRC
jgi:hypothetical protein